MDYFRKGLNKEALYGFHVDLRSEGIRMYTTEKRLYQFVQNTVQVIQLAGRPVGDVIGVPGRNLQLCYAMCRDVASLTGAELRPMHQQQKGTAVTIPLDILADWNAHLVWKVIESASPYPYNIIAPIIQEDCGFPISFPQCIVYGPKVVLDEQVHTNY